MVLGTWVENDAETGGTCGGDLTPMNAVFTGDVQDSTLGVDEVSLDAQISIYPNPVKDQLHISRRSLTLDKVRIYDVLGKAVLDAGQAEYNKCVRFEFRIIFCPNSSQ